MGFFYFPLESQHTPAGLRKSKGGGGRTTTVSVAIVPPPASSGPYSLRFLLFIERYDATERQQQAVSP